MLSDAGSMRYAPSIGYRLGIIAMVIFCHLYGILMQLHQLFIVLPLATDACDVELL